MVAAPGWLLVPRRLLLSAAQGGRARLLGQAEAPALREVLVAPQGLQLAAAEPQGLPGQQGPRARVTRTSARAMATTW